MSQEHVHPSIVSRVKFLSRWESAEFETIQWLSAGGTLSDASQSWVTEGFAYYGEKIGEGKFESYGHYTQVCYR